MYKIFLLSILILSSLNASNHPSFFKLYQSVPLKKATLLQTGKEKKFCPVCGMNLPMWYKTNHAAQEHHKHFQYCSLHCLTEDMQTKNLKNIQVVDVTSLKFINVQNAFYVVGSKKKGTMTMLSKYAFKNKKDAQAFVHQFGGTIKTFQEALQIAKKDFPKETKMIHKKQSMMAQKGKVIYNKICKKTSKKFNSVAQAKSYIIENKICGDIKGKKLQMIGLYLSGK